MNQQRIKGAVDELAGSAKMHFGNLIGNTRMQLEGAAQQIKGKIETAVGELKDHLQTPSESNL